MDIHNHLQLLGLTDKEATVYIASLELGQSPITPLARKTRIPRTSLQYMLEKLQSLGLIQIVQRGSRRVYTPIPPNGFDLLKQKEDQSKVSWKRFRRHCRS